MPSSLRNIEKIFWWLYIHAGVIQQPIFRLHNSLPGSAQGSLRSWIIERWEEGLSESFMASWVHKGTQNFLFFTDCRQSKLFVFGKFLKKTWGIEQIWQKVSFKLDLCLDFRTSLTSHVRYSVTVRNVKIWRYEQFLSMTSGVFMAIIFLNVFFGPMGGPWNTEKGF